MKRLISISLAVLISISSIIGLTQSAFATTINYAWINGIPNQSDDTHFEWINGVPFVRMSAGAAVPDISNAPTTKDFGTVKPGTSYYAKGSAPSNPVVDGDCTFTVTNNGSGVVNLSMSCTDFTGGNTWTLVAGAPTGDQIRITAYYSGQDPSSGLVLTNSNQAFYASLATAGTIKWDFREDLVTVPE